MTNLPNELPDGALEIPDGPRLIWILVRDVVQLLWKQNPKKHDIGLLAQSIVENGFRDPAAYDSRLEAIIYGNGRVAAVWWLEQQAKPGDAPPRGVGRQRETGYWAIPLLVGVDSESESLAKRFALDHNNLTLSGGDFQPWEFEKLWDEQAFAALLEELAESGDGTLALDSDDIEEMRKFHEFLQPEFSGIVEEFEGAQRGGAEGNEQWFYVEFYKDEELFKGLTALLRPYLTGAHELDGAFFERAIRQAVENAEETSD